MRNIFGQESINSGLQTYANFHETHTDKGM
jgi:hypothetical protein